MEDKRYFTPNIEDIRVGYECELLMPDDKWYKVEISKPTNNEINKYYEVFFNQPLDLEGKFDITMSDVQEICLKNKLCPELAKQELINKIK